MSCYALDTKNPERTTCRVGWDSGANSFYAYVARTLKTTKDGNLDPELNGHVIKWVGTEDNEIPTVEALEREVTEYATLPETIKLVLWDDQRLSSAILELEGKSQSAFQ
jgi:hypothetical protein